MLNVKTVDEVLKIIGDNFRDYSAQKEKISLDNSLGRITAEDIYSSEDVPCFNRSLVDGYALIAGDTKGASESLPVELKLIGEVRMGEAPSFEIRKSCSAYIPTGGEIPSGADSVVMIEYTEKLETGSILIEKPAAPGNNIIFRGDDTKAGKIVIKANHRIRPQDIAALAAMGYIEVSVKRKLKAGIISTGDELVDVHEKISGSQVRDVNSRFLYSELIRAGVEAVLYGIVKDGFDGLINVVNKAYSACDIVLISGGSSVGRQDETYNVINALPGSGILVKGIAVKPGKPTIIADVKGKAVIGLPGHPVSAYFIYKIIISRLIEVMYGMHESIKSYIQAEMSCNYPSNEGREEYLPVILEFKSGRTFATPVFGKSGLIMLLANADGYVKISRGTEGLMAGQTVNVFPF